MVEFQEDINEPVRYKNITSLISEKKIKIPRLRRSMLFLNEEHLN